MSQCYPGWTNLAPFFVPTRLCSSALTWLHWTLRIATVCDAWLGKLRLVSLLGLGPIDRDLSLSLTLFLSPRRSWSQGSPLTFTDIMVRKPASTRCPSSGGEAISLLDRSHSCHQ